jgi:O-antigen/teichoic acid export membrane protein
MIAGLSIFTELVSTIAAVFLAWQGYGVWALVYSAILAAAIGSTAFLVFGLRRYHRPSFIYEHHSLKGFFSFGMYQMGERFINYLSAHIDKILIGKFAGMGAVGFYNMAWQLIIFPLSRINPIVNAVAFPTYSKLEQDISTRSRYYVASIHLLGLITIPLLAFLFFFANELVNIVFGPGWDKTVVLVQILSIVGVGKALGNPGGALILAAGRPEVGFWWNLAWAAVISIGMFVALWFEPTAESAAYMLLVLSLTVGSIWHYLIARLGNVAYRPILIQVGKIVAVSLICGFLAQIGVDTFGDTHILFRLLMGGSFFAVLYFGYLLIGEAKFLKIVFKRT